MLFNRKMKFVFSVAACTAIYIGNAWTHLNYAQAETRSKLDKLSLGPLSLQQNEIESIKNTLDGLLLYQDKDCHLSLESQNLTYPEADGFKVAESLCADHAASDKLIIYKPSLATLIGCLRGQLSWSARAAIGSNGLGKRKTGDRKTPIGTYWLGVPRKSNLFGIFIPLGYPNQQDADLGYTGNAIGIHGPARVFSCSPSRSLETHWTAGCLSVARDEQILNISKWILDNWPVQIEVKAE